MWWIFGIAIAAFAVIAACGGIGMTGKLDEDEHRKEHREWKRRQMKIYNMRR